MARNIIGMRFANLIIHCFMIATQKISKLPTNLTKEMYFYVIKEH